eukprot:TRINITY_DN20433_c0_g1_i1.p1 TRINITY_DN20433_c0_g1~~TRINITY_DN20433_c0_g1_i1.p1  ORF type:complete len:301 (+),score=72.50 TRINITY_DN20433_c0_g1_i1:135-905(+)
MRGLIFTVDPFKEGQAMKEIKTLIRKYADEEEEKEEVKPSKLSISDMLAQELQEEKEKPEMGNFTSTGCKGNLFYKLNPHVKQDPNTIALKIAEGIKSSGQQQSRFVYKMLPIFKTCAAHPEAIERELSGTLKSFCENFGDLGLINYALIWNKKSCSNTDLERVPIATALGKYMRPDRAAVDLKTPNYAIIVSIYKTVACLGFIGEYNTFKSFNIHKLGVGDKKENEDQPERKQPAEQPPQEEVEEAEEEAEDDAN